jgi:putative spermidine/putrescine transport system substrate-binding protein
MAIVRSRRTVLTGGSRLLLGGALAGALGPSLAARAADATVRATHFGGPYQVLRDIVAKPFEETKLGSVSYDAETSPSVIAKLQTNRGDPPFDVAMMSRSFALRALNAGLLAKVAPSDFPEVPNLIKDAMAPGGWGVAMMLDTFEILVDGSKVPEPLTSWLDLWRPDLKGKLVLPAAASPAAFHFIASIIHALGDYKSEATVNEAFDRLKALKASARSFVADPIQPTQLMERGDLAVAPQYGLRIALQGRNIKSVVKVSPKDGVLAIPYDLCVTQGAKDAALAKTFINFNLTAPVQAGIVQSLLATPVRPGVPVAPDIAPLVTMDTSKLWFLDEEFVAAKQREWLDRYTRTVQG